MAAKWWKLKWVTSDLDRRWPKPAWLELEPGEEYLGSYPRLRHRWMLWEGACIALFGIMLTVPFNTPDQPPTPLISFLLELLTWLSIVSAGVIELISRTNRVHLTSKALVFKERKQYRFVELAQITGVDYAEDFNHLYIRLHLAGVQQPFVLMDSVCLRQTAEELSQLIAQYGGREIEVKGGRK